ncbi:hypothetical protein ACQ4PT_000167 [Festuca glaucescens]
MAAHNVDTLALQEAQLPPSPDSSDGAEEEALGAGAEEELGVLPRRAMEKGHRSSWWRSSQLTRSSRTVYASMEAAEPSTSSWSRARATEAGAGTRSLPRRSPGPRCVGGRCRRLSEVLTFRDYTGPLLDILRSLPAGEKAVLVGHSYGGLNVALAAELFPEKVAAAVFLSAFMPGCVSAPSDVVFKDLTLGKSLMSM